MVNYMGIVREPLDVDFVVDPRPLSKEDQQKISEFIKADKKRRKELNISREKWKNKYLRQKQRADFLESELNSIKKKLNEIITD